MTLSGPEDTDGIEGRRLEQNARGLRAHLGALAAHHACQCDWATVVGDDDVLGIELAYDAVERCQLLPRPRVADGDGP